ncbi:MAG TPA: AI-2E family transporter [Anaerolineae bacterium]|nr:AI-2E family transporter [Anaerolineae bacterium]
MSQTLESAPTAGAEDRLVASVQKSREAWRRLGMRLHSITPSGLAHILLVVGALATVTWVLRNSAAPLIPFLTGLALAYITAPLVEGLDRVLPRWLAVLLVIVGELVFLLLTVAVLVLPLARELIQILQNLPSSEQLRRFFDDLVAYLRTLPEPTQAFIRDGLRQVAVQIRDNLATYFQRATDLGIGALFSLIKTFSFVVGLLVLPTWLYSVMADQKRASRALDRVVPDWAKADFWAVVRIVDRTLSASLRGLVLQAFAVGMATYLGLVLLEQFGLLAIKYKLLAAVLAGLMELIPEIGPFLWAIPAAAIGFSNSREMGLALLGAYLLGRWLVHRLLVSRIEQRVVGDIHPAFMVVAIVALSQFGVIWLFLAAPVVAIARNLFRYVYGRVSDPPRPAGLLPDEPLPVPQEATSVPARQAARRRNRRSEGSKPKESTL